MSDTLNIGNFTGLGEGYAALAGSTYSTGDIRRVYNFGNRFSEINPMQDPYFRLMSLLRKGSVNDTIFKFTEKRPSWNKRYAYVTAHGTAVSVSTTSDATVTAASIEAGDTYYFKMGTDMLYTGNLQNKYGQATSEITIGDAYTAPKFFLVNQVVKIPFGATYNSPDDYILGKIKSITAFGTTHQILELEITKTLKTATNNELQWASATAPMTETYTYATANSRADGLESKRSYVVSTAFAPGSGYPDTWADNPFSTGYGFTEIFKVALGMDNSTRATEMRFQPNEWQRLWKEKLLESRWDIAQALYFSSPRTDSDGAQHTQGIVDYILNYGNVFSLTTSSKSADDFLDDMSQFMDPRTNSQGSMVYFCDTSSYNWLNKLSGYSANTLELSTNYRQDFQALGRNAPLAAKTGVQANTISTVYGDMNVVRDIHLDGSPVKILGVNLNNVEYCPLVGNGINRDTSIYVGVQTLENSGVDKRIDLILTEAGQKCSLPETMAAWV